MSAGGHYAGERSGGGGMVQAAPKAITYPQEDQTQVSKQAQVAPKAPSVQRSQTRQLELMVPKTRCAGPVCVEWRCG